MNPVESELKRISACLMVIVAVLLMYAVYWLRPVLIPFVVALFVVSVVSPLIRVLEGRLHLNRYISIGVAFVCGLLLIVALGISLWLSIQQIATQGSAYAERVTELLEWGQEYAETRFGIASSAGAGESSDGTSAANQIATPLQTMLDRWVRSLLASLSAELLSLVSSFAVVVIFVFFLLLGELGESQHSLLGKIDFQMRSYLLVKTAISIVTGAAFGLVLWLFGVPMALTFGLLAFLLNYIPNFGPIVAMALPIPFILLLPDASWQWMLAAIAVSAAVQMISGNIVEPQMMGSSSGLHPVAVMLGLMLWGMLWGIVGMFLATPIMAAIKLALERSPSTRPIANVLAGDWALDADSDAPQSV